MEQLMKAGFLAFDQTPLLQIDGLNLVQKFAAVRCALPALQRRGPSRLSNSGAAGCASQTWRASTGCTAPTTPRPR